MGSSTSSPSGSVPLFPLPGLVALPGTEVGFHFFEARYRAMARELRGEGDGVGRELLLCEVIAGEDPRRDDCALHPIASVGRVVASEANADGTIDVLLSVRARAQLTEVDRGERPFRLARYDALEDIVREGPALEVTEASLRAMARELVEIERELGGGQGVRFDGSPGVLADRLADRYFRRVPGLRRRVLETRDVLARGELVLEHIAKILVAIRAAQRELPN